MVPNKSSLLKERSKILLCVRGSALFRWHPPPWTPWDIAQCCFLGSTPIAPHSTQQVRSTCILFSSWLVFLFIPAAVQVPEKPGSFCFCDLSCLPENMSYLVTQLESPGSFRNICSPSFLKNTTAFIHLMHWPVGSCEWRSGWPLLLSWPGCRMTEMLSFAGLSRLEFAPCLFPHEILMDSRSFFFLLPPWRGKVTKFFTSTFSVL